MRLSARIAAAGLFLALAAAPAAAIWGDGGVNSHGHTSTTDGGGAVAPLTFTLPATSTITTAGQIANSSMTIIPYAAGASPYGQQFVQGAGTFGACMPSTVTVRFNGGTKAEITLNAVAGGNVIGTHGLVNVLMDGAYIAPFTSTKGITGTTALSGSVYEQNIGFTIETGVVVAGTHAFCLQGMVTSANAYYMPYWNETVPTFRVKDLK